MTIWQIAGTWFALSVYTIAFFQGGRPERFGAAVLILDGLVSLVLDRWGVSNIYPALMAKELFWLLLVGGLAFRSDRWWPFVMTAALCLIILVYGLRLIDPSLSLYAAMSAHIGLDYLVDLALLFGVWERWLAGEAPARRAAWAAAERATAARRGSAASHQPVRGPGLMLLNRKVGAHTTSLRRGRPR